MEEARGTQGASPHSTLASACLWTSSLWMGPGGFRGPTECLASYLIPAMPLRESLSCSAPAALKGHSVTCLSQEHGVLVGQAPSNHETHTGRPLLEHGAHLARHPSGLGTKGPCTESPHCIAPPAHLLVRPDPEHRRARPGLTDSSSWSRSVISVASFQQVVQRLPHHSGHWALSPRGHHLSSLQPLYSSHVEISMKFSLTRGLDKMIRKQAGAAATCPSWPSGPTPVPQTWPEQQGPFLSALMDTYWLTWVA